MRSKLLFTLGAVAGTAAVTWNLKPIIEGSNESKQSLVEEKHRHYGSEIQKARELVLKHKTAVAAPGMVVAVSVNGTPVWKEGFGYADLENGSPCHGDTVMRIASISKSITMALVAKLVEDGKLDLDKPIKHYVPNFPDKTFEGNPVEITTRQLVSHLSGIRGYRKKGEKFEREHTEPSNGKTTRMIEVYNKNKYNSVEEAVKMFANDELLSEPGSKYFYTTHGWTLISAVVEGAAKENFEKQIKKLFVNLGLKNTKLDENEPIIYNRADYYRINKRGGVVNASFVDNSYKWAGGGFLSTVGDLIKFANSMLYSYQWKPGIIVHEGKITKNVITEEPIHPIPDLPHGFLKPETMEQLWRVVPKTQGSVGIFNKNGYGMGWQVIPLIAEYGTTGGGDIQQFQVLHSGSAVGASSILHILPTNDDKTIPPPQGVCVALITNLEDVSFYTLADNIAHIFAGLR